MGARLVPPVRGVGYVVSPPLNIILGDVVEIESEKSRVLHQLRNYCTVLLGGVENGQLDLAQAALEKAEDCLYEYAFIEVSRLH